MEHTFLTALHIKKVRHLQDIEIPLSDHTRKNLILTGKNGCGKTSVLNALVSFLEFSTSDSYRTEQYLQDRIAYYTKSIASATPESTRNYVQARSASLRNLAHYEEQLTHWTTGCIASVTSEGNLIENYQNGSFILAYYSDSRKISITSYKNIEKVELQTVYKFSDNPSKELGKYLVNLKSIQAFAQSEGNTDRAVQIKSWFDRFEHILRMIYHDDSLQLHFDVETFQFSILIDGREPFTFNTMSMGYAAIFDIVGDLIMRMESQKRYDLEGIVLIDEIETHLHVELQKDIMPILTELFPNIQFILTTHSPFILNSTPNAVIYDLEKRILVADGMTNLSYEGIVEGYFDADLLSSELRNKFEEYKQLVQANDLSDTDYAKIAELEYYLDEVPDYLALDFSEEYSRLKTELNSR